MTPSFVLPFEKLDRKSVKIAGGKGANLGEMTKLKISVPPGFVVLATAFDRFLEETDLDVEIDAALKKLNHKDLTKVDEVSNRLRSLIRKASMPKDLKAETLEAFKHLGSQYVAVRSSATAEDSKVASWAGELESFLFVTRPKLLKMVQECWSSLFTPRAIFYRFEKKLHKSPVSVAVVVQEMVDSEVSGVAFTVHPVTRDRNQMVIEAGWGLGEAIVSGRITPDTYVLDKKRDVILDANVSRQHEMIVRKGVSGSHVVPVPDRHQEKQKLMGRQVIELLKLCKKIEKHYKGPQDIEWTFAHGKFSIVQVRPITTLGKS